MAIVAGTITETIDTIKVVSICYTTDIPESEDWHQVDAVPEYPVTETGKKADMFFNTATKEFIFEISDRLLTQDEEKDAEIIRLKGLLDDATGLLVETGGL
jgi:hypothetical protein